MSQQILKRAAGLGSLTLVSSALGFLREMVIARRFGATHATDSYAIAFSVPVLLYCLFFGSGLNVSLVPRMAVALREDRSRAHAIFAQFLSGAAFFSGAASLILLAFPGLVIRVFAPGIAASAVAVESLRAVAPLLFLFVVTYALGSFQCAQNHLSQWGLIPVLHNVVLLSFLFFAAQRWGIVALLLGTVAGGFVSFIWQTIRAHATGFREAWHNPFVPGQGRQILAGMLPFALAGGTGGDYGTSQADIFLVRFFASPLRPGSISLLGLGNKLMGAPVLLIGAALGLALLPSLSIALAEGDHAAAGRHLCDGFSYVLMLALPIAIIYLDMGGAIAGLAFHGTALIPEQLQELGQILRGYSGAVVGIALVYVLNSYLAAKRRTRTLIVAGMCTIIVNVAFMWVLRQMYGAVGIAAAVSCSSLVYCSTLLILVAKELPAQFRWNLAERAAVVLAGAAAMHLLLGQGLRIHPSTSPAAVASPLILSAVVYSFWLLCNRARLGLKAAPALPL